MQRLNAEQVQEEIDAAKKMLEDKLGQKVVADYLARADRDLKEVATNAESELIAMFPNSYPRLRGSIVTLFCSS